MGALQSILDNRMFSSVKEFFRVILTTLYQTITRLKVFMLFDSPAMLIIVLCTTNGEKEEIVSPFSEWIIKRTEYIRLFFFC